MKFKWGIIILIVLLLGVTCFIWGMSLPSIPESRAESSKVIEFLKPLLEPIVGEGNVTEKIVRKTAHFIEFFAFGTIVTAFAAMLKRIRLLHVVLCHFVSMAVAVIDETIQHYTGRGSQITDVWLDFFGAAAGIAVVLVVYFIGMLIKTKKSDTKEP